MEYQTKNMCASRVFRAAIFNGVAVPEAVRATLEARGINTQELEARLRQQITWSHEQ